MAPVCLPDLPRKYYGETVIQITDMTQFDMFWFNWPGDSIRVGSPLRRRKGCQEAARSWSWGETTAPPPLISFSFHTFTFTWSWGEVTATFLLFWFTFTFRLSGWKSAERTSITRKAGYLQRWCALSSWLTYLSIKHFFVLFLCFLLLRCNFQAEFGCLSRGQWRAFGEGEPNKRTIWAGSTFFPILALYLAAKLNWLFSSICLSNPTQA